MRSKKDELDEKCGNPYFRKIWETTQEPMMVLQLGAFEAFGMVPRSSDRVAVPFLQLPARAKVVFVSHRWMRPWHTQAECHAHQHVWAGGPHPDAADNSKHSTLCQGVKALATQRGWDPREVYLWMDFFSVEQDNARALQAGIASLLGYVIACDEMVVPCPKLSLGSSETATSAGWAGGMSPGLCGEDVSHDVYHSSPLTAGANFVDSLPCGFGDRAWSRLEAMAFYTAGALGDVAGQHQIVAVATGLDQELVVRTCKVDVAGGEVHRPSQGALFNEADREAIEAHEQVMLQFLRSARRDPALSFRFMLANMTSGLQLDGAILLMGAQAASDQYQGHQPLIQCPELSFRGNQVQFEGAKAAAIALRPRRNCFDNWEHSKVLRCLDLEGNSIRDEGAKVIAAALAPQRNCDGSWAFNMALEELWLQDNYIKAEGATALAEALLSPRQDANGYWRFNTSPLELLLVENYIGDAGAQAIAAAVEPRKNPDGAWALNHGHSTTALHLSHNGIGGVGWQAIAAALRPRETPDGGWVCNITVKDLRLGVVAGAQS